MVDERCRFNIDCRRDCLRMQKVLVTDYQHPLRKSGDVGNGALQPLDNERTRGAPRDLARAEAVDVRVIPVETWRLILWS